MCLTIISRRSTTILMKIVSFEQKKQQLIFPGFMLLFYVSSPKLNLLLVGWVSGNYSPFFEFQSQSEFSPTRLFYSFIARGADSCGNSELLCFVTC